MLAYLSSKPVPIIPLNKASYRSNAIFAKQGGGATESYDWDVLMVYIAELKGTIRLAVSLFAALEDVLLWRTRKIPFSLALCIGFQMLVGMPHYLPAAGCLSWLLFLLHTYSLSSSTMEEGDANLDKEIHARPSFLQHIGALLFDRARPPLTVQPAGTLPGRYRKRASGLASAPASEDRFWSASAAVDFIKTDVRHSAEDYWREKMLGDAPGTEMDGSSAELAKEKAGVEAEVAAFIDQGDDSIAEKIVKRRVLERKHESQTMMERVAITLNPVAVALGPLQKTLASVLVPLRAIRYALFWQDRIVTTWLCLALAALTLVNALLPWRWMLFYGCRLAGALLLGPHMHLLGRRVDSKRLLWRLQVQEYDRADTTKRREIIDAYWATLMEAARKQVRGAQIKLAGHSKAELERQAYLEHQRFNFLNGNTPSNARIRYVAVADPSRSSARPLKEE